MQQQTAKAGTPLLLEGVEVECQAQAADDKGILFLQIVYFRKYAQRVSQIPKMT